MTDAAKQLQEIDSDSFSAETPQPTNLISRRDIIRRLRRGRTQRSRFVESHISKTLAFQIRSLRDKKGWSQQQLATEIGSNQNAVYRAENPNYGKQTITTLKKIAAAFDVAVIVRFVPFSELTDWVSGTPHVNEGLNSEALDVSDFETEEKEGKFDDKSSPQKEEREPPSCALTVKPGSWNQRGTGLREPSPEWLTGALESGQRELMDYLTASNFRAGNLRGLGGPGYMPASAPSLADQYEEYQKSLAQQRPRDRAMRAENHHPLPKVA